MANNDKVIDIKDSKGNTVEIRVEHPDGSSDTYKHDSSLINQISNAFPVPTGLPSNAGEHIEHRNSDGSGWEKK
jgi:hypothetical protein